MEEKEIYSRLRSVFKEQLEHDNFELLENTKASDIDGWDSVTHMMIIDTIETQFEIKFELMELMEMDTVGNLVMHIKSKV